MCLTFNYLRDDAVGVDASPFTMKIVEAAAYQVGTA